MYDNNRPVGSTVISAEVDSHHQGVINSYPLEFFSGDPRDRSVYSRNGARVSSTVTSVVGAHHGATPGFSYRHQHKVAPVVTTALAAVATSTEPVRPYPQKRGHWGQTAVCIRIPLGTEVGLSLGDIVLDGDSAPPPLKGHNPNFRPMSIAAKR